MKIPITKLKQHPLNIIFGNLPNQEYKALKEDIKERGIQNQIDITEDYIIVCGHQRIKICKELGIKEVEVKILKGLTNSQIKEHLIKDNILRRQLTTPQILEAGKELEKIYEGRRGKGGHLSTFKGKTRDLVAKDFSISGRTYDRIKEAGEIIKEKKDPKLTNRWENNQIKPIRIIRDFKMEKQVMEIEEGIKKPTGKFDVIIIDPPWKYDDDGKYDPDGRRGACPYPCMTFEELSKIKIPTEKNCVVWLWTTNAFMEDAFKLLRIWGFQHKGILTWDKQIIGMGRWLRNKTEHCILAIKGKPVWTNKIYNSLISEKRTTHSTKPEIFYKMVEEICYGKKLDYFGRKKRKGWDVYGDEVK